MASVTVREALYHMGLLLDLSWGILRSLVQADARDDDFNPIRQDINILRRALLELLFTIDAGPEDFERIGISFQGGSWVIPSSPICAALKHFGQIFLKVQDYITSDHEILVIPGYRELFREQHLRELEILQQEIRYEDSEEEGHIAELDHMAEPDHMAGADHMAEPDHISEPQHIAEPEQVRLEEQTEEQIQEQEGRNSSDNEQGATQEQIDSLGVQIAEQRHEGRHCSICLEGIVIGQRIRFLPCAHCFHQKCIDNWLRINDMCPVDRHRIS